MKKKKILLVIVPLVLLIFVALLWREDKQVADGANVTLYGNVDIREEIGRASCRERV